ncbi:hypothetical protein HDU93_001746 [Gonapodya sp. JEL0774]|nr:hypothetical protein HDU93_001746 [Gonapodya sp. JEL0774]
MSDILPLPTTVVRADPGRVLTISKSTPLLFQPLKIRGIEFKNRIFVAPMCQYSCENGFFTAWHLAHLGQYASRGASLVIFEATGVQPNGRITPNCPGLWSDDHVPGLKKIADYVRNEGSIPGIQLAHAGRKGSNWSPFLGKGPDVVASTADGGWPENVVSASAIPYSNTTAIPRAMSKADIDECVKAWGDAARRANICGFDIHAAHGYLLHQFLSSVSNQRTDDYGGSLENRSRLLLRIIQEVRKPGNWPTHKPVFVRLSCTEYLPQFSGSWDLEQSIELSRMLRDAGVDLIDCSSGNNHPDQKIKFFPGYQVPFADAIRTHAGIATGAVGMITDGKQAAEILEKGQADVVLVAREFLRDSAMVMRWARELGIDVEWPIQYHRSRPRLDATAQWKLEGTAAERAQKKAAAVETFIDSLTGRTLTLLELRDRIDYLARALVDSKAPWGGWRKSEVIALFSPNHIEYPVALWAGLRAGGVVTTMNPGYTATEVAFQLRDSHSKAIVTTTAQLPVAIAACRSSNIPSSHIIVIDAPGVTYLFEGQTFLTIVGLVEKGKALKPTPRVKVNTEETALLMYSSGTTGRSKGVESSHRNIITNVLQVAADGTGMALAGDTIVGVLPFYHCYGLTYTVHWAVYSGLRNVVFGQFKLETFLEAVAKYKVNVAHLVPPIMIQLAKNPIVEKADFSSLRWIISGAAPMAGELGVEVRQRCGVQIKQAWGMTELSPVSTVEPCGRVVDGSVGVLLPNQEAKIVDPETLKELGYNEEGELLVRGPNRMKGYLNNAKANAETITADGFLRTGDLAVVDENGVFYIRDRLKELIKVKGFQVAPAELEGLLLTHDAVADCAVIPIEDAYSGEAPKAFVVLKPAYLTTSASEKKALIQSILKKVHADLAKHKHITGGVELLEAIPKTASGKILRRTLRDMEREKVAKKTSSKL